MLGRPLSGRPLSGRPLSGRLLGQRGQHTSGKGVGLPALPAGYAFVTDSQGRFYVNSAGAYYIRKVA